MKQQKQISVTCSRTGRKDFGVLLLTCNPIRENVEGILSLWEFAGIVIHFRSRSLSNGA
jgi:hypothetical protein